MRQAVKPFAPANSRFVVREPALGADEQHDGSCRRPVAPLRPATRARPRRAGSAGCLRPAPAQRRPAAPARSLPARDCGRIARRRRSRSTCQCSSLRARLLRVDLHHRALGEHRHDARDAELGGLLHDEVHALAARDALQQRDLQRRLALDGGMCAALVPRPSCRRARACLRIRRRCRRTSVNGAPASRRSTRVRCWPACSGSPISALPATSVWSTIDPGQAHASSMPSVATRASRSISSRRDDVGRHEVDGGAERADQRAALERVPVDAQAAPFLPRPGRARGGVLHELDGEDHAALADLGDVSDGRAGAPRSASMCAAVARLRSSTGSSRKIASVALAAAQASGLPV